MLEPRLPAESGRAGAGDRALEHPGRGQLRHDAVRAGVDVGRYRAGRARSRLLHHRRQPQGSSTAPRSRRPVERLCRHGVDGILAITPHEEAAEALCTPRRGAARGGRGRPRPCGPGRVDRPVRRRGQAPRAICSTSATRPCGTSPGPRTFSSRKGRLDGWRCTLQAGRRRGAAAAYRRLERARRLRPRPPARGGSAR